MYAFCPSCLFYPNMVTYPEYESEFQHHADEKWPCPEYKATRGFTEVPVCNGYVDESDEHIWEHFCKFCGCDTVMDDPAKLRPEVVEPQPEPSPEPATEWTANEWKILRDCEEWCPEIASVARILAAPSSQTKRRRTTARRQTSTRRRTSIEADLPSGKVRITKEERRVRRRK